jgi:hypothetical protein
VLAGFFFFVLVLLFAIVLSDELMLLDELMLSEELLGELIVPDELLGELMLPEELGAGVVAVVELVLLGSAAKAVPPSSVISAKVGTMILSECI